MDNPESLNNIPSLTDSDRTDAVVQQYRAQNPWHGALAEAWRRIGGMDHLVQFGVEHPDKFYKLMAAATPGLVPTHGMQGDVEIHVHGALAEPSPLDGDFTEVEDAEDG